MSDISELITLTSFEAGRLEFRKLKNHPDYTHCVVDGILDSTHYFSDKISASSEFKKLSSRYYNQAFVSWLNGK